MRKKINQVFLKLALLLVVSSPLATAQPLPFALFTIPKSGSHLLIKSLYLMTGFTPAWHIAPPQIEALYHNRQFPYTHMCVSTDLTNYYSLSPVKKIVGIRDLRDVCVSIVYQILKGTWPEFTNNPDKLAEFKRLSFDQQLLFVINQDYEVSPPHIALQLSIKKVADQAVLFIQDPAFLVCRYEDLVGVEGGGNTEARNKLLSKIALHLGISLPAEKIEALGLSLYGNQENPFGQGLFSNYQSTFRKGKIGSWKTVFKETHKEAFKKRLGPALIALGYEKNNDW